MMPPKRGGRGGRGGDRGKNSGRGGRGRGGGQQMQNCEFIHNEMGCGQLTCFVLHFGHPLAIMEIAPCNNL